MLRHHRSMLGVTLLEIMLVLAIAGMIIVMSVRYYQSASSANQSNTVLQQAQAIIAAEESTVQTYAAYQPSTSTNLTNILPKNALTTPWGTTIVVTTTGSTFTMSFPSVPTSVCPSFNAAMVANSRITVSSGSCGAAASTMDYLYQ